jgi:hypothetical protein
MSIAQLAGNGKRRDYVSSGATAGNQDPQRLACSGHPNLSRV